MVVASLMHGFILVSYTESPASSFGLHGLIASLIVNDAMQVRGGQGLPRRDGMVEMPGGVCPGSGALVLHWRQHEGGVIGYAMQAKFNTVWSSCHRVSQSLLVTGVL